MMQIRKFLIFPEFWTSGQGDWHWSYLIMHLVTLPSYDTVNLLSKIFLKIQTQEYTLYAPEPLNTNQSNPK